MRIKNLLLPLSALVLGVWVQPAVAEDKASKVIADFIAAYDRVQNFEGRIAVATHAKGKDSSSKYYLALKKPNHTSFTMLENPKFRLAEGTKIVWHGGPNVDLKTKFFGLPLKMSVKYDDSRLSGIRGDNMYDVSVAKAVLIVKDPGARFRYIGTDKVAGRLMDVVEVKSPSCLRGIEREQFWLDRELHLPFARTMYENGKVAYHVEIETFTFDKPLPDDTFKVD